VAELARNSVQELAETLGRFTSVCVDIAFVTLPRSEFEHAQEARSAFLLLRGHARALQLLVDAGPHMYPSGWPIARSMLEVGIRTAWRMDHDDPMEAEARWVAWLGRLVEYERRNAKSMAADGLTGHAEWATSLAETAESVRRTMGDLLAQRGVKTPKGEPSMRQVMESLGLPAQRYQSYAEASERQHGSFIALDAYSRHFGRRREHGEFAQWRDWIMPLTVGMRGTYVLAQIFADRTKSLAMWDEVATAVAAWERVLTHLA
jgi:hypothetical protein